MTGTPNLAALLPTKALAILLCSSLVCQSYSFIWKATEQAAAGNKNRHHEVLLCSNEERRTSLFLQQGIPTYPTAIFKPNSARSTFTGRIATESSSHEKKEHER